MADNVVLSAGTADGVTLAADDIGGVLYQRVKITWGADNSATDASAAAPLPVVQTGTHTVTGAGGTFPVTDSGGSLTVDAPVATPVFVRLSDGASAISALPITDNAGSITVDNGGTFAVQASLSAAIPAGTNNIGDVDVLSIAAGDNNIGNVDIVTVPTDPFGANADAASATGSISAKLRFIASTGIPITGTVTVGSHAVTNAGTFVTQENGAALTALQLIDDCVIADDAAFTPATTKVTVAGFFADETATDSVDEGDSGAARMTLDRKLISTTYAHAAAGGATPYYNLDVDETEDDIKTSAGKLYWIHVINRSTGVRYLKFYNATAANVTVGTTTPVLSFPIPTMADTNGAGFCVNFGDMGVQFSTAICVAATTGVADSDTGAPGSSDVVLNAGYA